MLHDLLGQPRNCKKNSDILNNEGNQILVGPEEKLKYWKEHVTKLLNRMQRTLRPIYEHLQDEKLMVFSKVQTQAVLGIHNHRVEQVSSLRYLGALMWSTCNSTKEILSRIELKGLLHQEGSGPKSLNSNAMRLQELDISLEKCIEAFEMYLNS